MYLRNNQGSLTDEKRELPLHPVIPPMSWFLAKLLFIFIYLPFI